MLVSNINTDTDIGISTGTDTTPTIDCCVHFCFNHMHCI